MKKIITSLFVAVCFVACNSSAHPLSDRLKGEMRKVVKVYANTLDGKRSIIGSGFALDDSRIITAGHLCQDIVNGVSTKMFDGKMSAEGIDEKGQTYRVKGIEILKFELSDTRDICILFKAGHRIPPVTISTEYNKVQWGDRVYIVGSPTGMFPVITEGLVSLPIAHHMPMESLNNKLMSSAPAFAGNSGGPVFNEKGDVIGILVMANPKYSNVTFAVTSDTLLQFLAEPF